VAVAKVAKTPAPAGDPSGSAEPARAAGTPAGGGRIYGAEGVDPSVMNLAGAFARALPAAVSADRAWSRLALGEIGTIELSLRVDGSGKIADVRLREPDEAPASLRRLADRTVALLRSGRFALSSAAGAGTETLRVEVVLSQRAPIESASARPQDVLQLGHELPLSDRPGRSYFTLASGRHFEATITILSSQGAGARARPPQPEEPQPEPQPEEPPEPERAPVPDGG
jgi:hypothetical protein